LDNQDSSFRVLSEERFHDYSVQLLEDREGGVYLRKVSADQETVLFSAPLYSDLSALAEARELFPDLLPLGGIPVDAV
jgi:mannose/cellobiose epimerase-like protein (N-acyl-D-glucosamine 2-epimerase family)